MNRNIKSVLLSTAILVTAAFSVQAADFPAKKPATFNTNYFKRLQSNVEMSTQNIKWVNFGPAMSGYCDEFWIHPTDPKFMYTSLDMGNSYYTDNDAYSWTTTMDWDNPNEQERIGWIDFSRQDPTFALALDDLGYLMQSTDQGRTFDYITNAENFHLERGHSKKGIIVCDPSNDNNWYIGSGQPWKVKQVHRSEKNIHGTQTRNTAHGIISLSKDRGMSWKTVTPGPKDLSVLRLFVNPNNSDKIYAITNYGFMRSTNGGYDWTTVGKGLPFNTPRDGAFYVDPKSGKVTLFLVEQTRYKPDGKSVISEGGVFRSDDEGSTWVNITGDMELDFTILGKNYQITSQYYRALGYWFGISSKEAMTLYPERPKSILSVYNRILVNPKNPNEIFVMNNVKHDFSFGPVQMWKSVDGGKHWYSTVRTGSYWSKKTNLDEWKSRGADDPMGMNAKFAHMHHEMENEVSWAGVRYAEFNNRGEMLMVHEQQVFKSLDSGENWQQIDDIESTPGNWVGKGCSNLPGHGVIVDSGMKRNLYLSGEHGLWISGDMGDCKYDGVAVYQLTGQSKKRYDAVSIATAAVNPRDTNQIFMLMLRQSYGSYLRASNDCGKSWYTVNEEVPALPYKMGSNLVVQRSLRIDRDDPKRMYFTVPQIYNHYHLRSQWTNNAPPKFPKDSKGVYRSMDGGVTWSIGNEGIPKDLSIWSITMDRDDSRTLYACVTGKLDNPDPRQATKAIGGGLYCSNNGGDSWKKMKIPVMIECVNELYIDNNTGEFYLSAGQAHGEIEEGGVWISSNKGKNWKKIFEMPHVKSCYSSMVNPNIIAVNVGKCNKIKYINPGAYISIDGGSNWNKANYKMGLPERITYVAPDSHDENVFWMSNQGSGWYKGTIVGELK